MKIATRQKRARVSKKGTTTGLGGRGGGGGEADFEVMLSEVERRRERRETGSTTLVLLLECSMQSILALLQYILHREAPIVTRTVKVLHDRRKSSRKFCEGFFSARREAQVSFSELFNSRISFFRRH